MLSRLPTFFLLAIISVFSMLGCAKKEDDPIAIPTNTGSYKLDGSIITCQTQAKAYNSPASSGAPAYDYFELNLITTPQPANGAQVLKILFYKQSAYNTYMPSDIGFYTNGVRTTTYYSALAGTVMPVSGGGFSGTFTATIQPPNYSVSVPVISVSEGVFTNVRP